MGLFDIFRRHKKKTTTPASEAADQQSAAASQAPQSTVPAQSTAPTEQPTSATSATPARQRSRGPVGSATPEETKTSAQPTAVSQATEEKQPAAVTEQPTTAATQPTTTPQATSTQPTAPLAAPNDQPTAVSESTAPTSAPAPVSDATSASAASGAKDVANSASATKSTAAESAADETSPASAAASTEPTSETDTAADQTVKKYDRGLAKSRTGFGARLNRFLANFRHVDEDFFDDLEDMLIESDVGYDMAMKLSDELREEVKLENAKSKQEVSNVIIEKMVDLYDAAGKDENPDLNMAKSGPTVIMFVGVNGAGKTTTIGKMAALFKKQGKKVLLAAADTFRAGATEQLDVWAKRDGVDIVTGPENGDPAAVVFDAVQKAKKEDYDILFVDTAGRLQNKVNLMKELAKMKRILTREIPDAPHEVLLVLDATTGQNALNQAKLFKQSTDVTGIVLTKLDGTARGGIVLAIRNELHLPVKYVGLGEKVDDLQKFDASDFVYGLFKGLVDVD